MQAGQGGERGEAKAAERERADLRDRDRVAMNGQVVGGRNGRSAQHDRARRQRDGIGNCRARAAFAIDHPAQGDDDGKRRHRRHHFLPDGDRERAEEAGERAVARTRRHAHEQGQRPDHQHDLHAVVMDGAGAEMLQHRRHQRGENQRHARRRVAGEFARQPQDAGEEDSNSAGRPHRQGNRARRARRQQQSRRRGSAVASGRSIRRDQCVTTPSGGLRRYCVRSNQFCPARKSRTSTSRMASSVDTLLMPEVATSVTTATHQISTSKIRLSSRGSRDTAG